MNTQENQKLVDSQANAIMDNAELSSKPMLYPSDLGIKKFHHESGQGIYAHSRKVKAYKEISTVAAEMVAWLDDNNGKFPEPYKMAYAVSHCQVAADPYAFFVVSDEFILGQSERPRKDTKKNYYFPSRVIINAQVLESPDKIPARIPKREVTKDPETGKVGSKIVVTKGDANNKISVPEACMSFPNRSQKNIERYYRIKVRYQVPRTLLGIPYLKTITEWAEGLKAHVFQHEIDHANAKNMYYSK